MAHVQANIARFYAKLGEFWSAEKYSDVTIACDDGTVFKCHRIALATACEYFDTMFSSNFRERTADCIQLREISAATFGQVLQFMYTGDVAINVGNVFSLLQASELFKLSGIEDLCVQFVKMNSLTIPDTWDILAFARAANKKTLVDALIHRIALRFEIFSQDTRFLEVSFHDLSIILKQMCTSSMMRKDISVLAAISRWVEHKGEGSQCYLDELIELISFENIQSIYLKPIFAKFLANSTQSSKRFKGYSDVSELLQESAILRTERSLHVFFKYNKDNSMKIYSINSALKSSLSATIPIENLTNRSVCTVVVDDFYFYCLNYAIKASVDCGQTFYAHTSVNMSSQIKLKSPPVIFPFIRAVGQQNSIHYYNPLCVYQPVIRPNVSSSFNNEEISCGIYTYNCEVDNWFPVPTMKIKVGYSAVTTCNDKLYLIGGGTSESSKHSSIVQSYDSRVGKWEEMPRTNYQHGLAASCFMDGKIYVFGGDPDIKSAERYDLVAGRWENLPPMINGTKYYTTPAPCQYLKQLWVRSNGDFDRYNAESNEWNTTTILTDGNADLRGGVIMSAFVFKSL